MVYHSIFISNVDKISMCALRCHINIEPFYLILITIHITCGTAVANCASKLLVCLHR